MPLSRQRGVVTLIAVLLLLALVGMVLAMGLHIAGTDVSDSASQNQSIEALILAESGLERAAYNYSVSGTCTSAGVGTGVTAYSMGNGTFTLISAAPSGGQCQVRVSGTVGKVTRTVDGWYSGGGAIALDAVRSRAATTSLLAFAHPVAAGANILVVGVSIDRANTSINYVRYGGLNLTPLGAAFSGNNPEASIWYLLNPPAGTADVTVSLGQNEQIAAGAISFLGVDTTTPFDVAITTRTGNGTAATAPVTPVTAGAWIFDVMAVNNNNNVTPTATGQVQHWEYQVSGQVSGAASTIGPVNPAAPRTPRWTWIGSDRWAHAAVALRPGGSSQLVRWSELIQ